MTTTNKTATNNFKVDTAMNSAEDNTATGTEVAENKKARKPYSINPVIDEDSPVKFNHVDIYIENDVLKISGLFDCWKPETAYRRFRKIMAQVATEVPELEGWDEWEPAKKLTFDETEKIWLNENDEMIFDTKYTTNILNVDINEDTIYIWGTFYMTAEACRAAHPEEPNCNIELEVDNTVQVEYKPQTAWKNPHDFTTVGNLNGQPRKYVDPESIAAPKGFWAKRINGTYTDTINGEFVSFENHSIAYIDAEKKLSYHYKKSDAGRKIFYRGNQRFAASKIVEAYMNGEIAAEQNKAHHEFFDAHKTAYNNFFQVLFRVTTVDGRIHNFERTFATFDAAKALVDEFTATFDEPTDILIKRNGRLAPVYYTRTDGNPGNYTDAYFGNDGFDPEAFTLLPALDDLNDVEDANNDAATENNVELLSSKLTNSKCVFAYAFYLKEEKDIRKPHVLNNTGNCEWYTPPPVIEAVRDVLGQIDLDPASTNEANQIIGAKNFFTKDDDGLKQDWFGNVFLNPPYSRGLIDKFVGKLLREFADGRTTEAIVLTNAATDTDWAHKLMALADQIIFTKKRIKFLKPDGSIAGTPTCGQMFCYFGERSEKFYSAFAQFGLPITFSPLGLFF